MLRFKKIVYGWLPALIWMAIIFYFSSKTRVPVTKSYILSFILFKTLHLIEYAILYFLVFRAIYLNIKQKDIDKAYLYSFVISVLYAASDEFHQTLVPTREGRVRDVLIDTTSIILMYIYIRKNFKFLEKYL